MTTLQHRHGRRHVRGVACISSLAYRGSSLLGRSSRGDMRICARRSSAWCPLRPLGNPSLDREATASVRWLAASPLRGGRATPGQERQRDTQGARTSRGRGSDDPFPGTRRSAVMLSLQQIGRPAWRPPPTRIGRLATMPTGRAGSATRPRASLVLRAVRSPPSRSIRSRARWKCQARSRQPGPRVRGRPRGACARERTMRSRPRSSGTPRVGLPRSVSSRCFARPWSPPLLAPPGSTNEGVPWPWRPPVSGVRLRSLCCNAALQRARVPGPVPGPGSTRGGCNAALQRPRCPGRWLRHEYLAPDCNAALRCAWGRDPGRTSGRPPLVGVTPRYSAHGDPPSTIPGDGAPRGPLPRGDLRLPPWRAPPPPVCAELPPTIVAPLRGRYGEARAPTLPHTRSRAQRHPCPALVQGGDAPRSAWGRPPAWTGTRQASTGTRARRCAPPPPPGSAAMAPDAGVGDRPARCRARRGSWERARPPRPPPTLTGSPDPGCPRLRRGARSLWSGGAPSPTG